jgi:hypothetical protein
MHNFLVSPTETSTMHNGKLGVVHRFREWEWIELRCGGRKYVGTRITLKIAMAYIAAKTAKL